MAENIPPPAPATQTNLSLDNKQQAQIQTQQQLFKLPVGAQFNAAVIGGDKNGNAIIKFGGNDLILSSPVALSKGAQVSLRVDGNSGAITLQLLSVDGKLPPTQAQATSNQLQNSTQQAQNTQLPILKVLTITPENLASAAKGAQQVPTAATQNAAPAQAVVIGSATTAVARGIVISPSPEALQNVRASVGNALPPDQAGKILQTIPQALQAGSEVNFKINNIQPPANSQTTATASPVAGAALDADAKVHTDNRTLAKQEFINPQNQQQTTQTTSQQTPQQGQTPQASATKIAFTPTVQTTPDGSIKINALVTGVNNSSQLVVETAIGKFSISTSLATNKVEIGSILNLQISNFGKIGAEAAPDKQNPIQGLANDWAALRELGQALNNAGQPNALSKIAGLDSIFASRLIAYMGAVKNNNMGNWLSSELMDVLDDSTREQILGKLRGDFTNMQRLLNDNPTNSWQTLLFPVFDGEELHQARLHLKYLEDENGAIDKEAGSRFLVEFEASYFGEMQLDGLVRKNKASSNFDLIVRTHKELEPGVELDIRTIFNNAQELTGFKGNIDFIAAKDFPHRPMDERLGRDLHSDGSIQA